MNKPEKMKSENKIYIITTIISVLLIAIGTFIYTQQEKNIKENLTITLDAVGKNTVRVMDEFMVNTYSDLVLISESSTLQAPYEKIQFGLLKYIKTFKTFDSLVYTDTSGNILGTSGDILLTDTEQNQTQAILGWFKKMVPSNKKLLSPLAYRGDFIRYFVFHKEVKNSDNKTIGHLFGQMNSEKLASYSIPIKIGETGRATLFNKDGILIGHPVKSRYGYSMAHYPIMKAPIEKWVNNDGGFFVSGDGSQKWGIVLLFENTQKQLGTKLGIIIDQTKEELYTEITNFRNSFLIVLGTLGVLLFYFFREHSNKLFVESLLSNIAEGVYGVDKDGLCIWINPKALEMLGFSEKEILHKDQHELFHHHKPQGEKYEVSDCPIHKTIYDRKTREVEEYFITKSGEFFPVSLTVAPVENSNGAIVVFRDVTELKKSQQHLEDAKQKAEAANKAKSQFLANMSHEIRTPMNAIIGLGDMLDDMLEDKKQKDMLGKINSSSKMLLGIINDILDFSKLEANKVELEKEPVEIENIFSQLRTLFGSKAMSEDLELYFYMKNDVPGIIEGDELRLNQVLSNLLSNALKFTSHGNVLLQIELIEKLDNEHAKLKFSVSDTGIGMNEEELSRIFQAFSQADVSTTRKYGGTGLGLMISSKIVEAMGSKLEVQSQKDVGSTFSFEVETKVSKWEQTLPTVEIKPYHILIVDDQEISRIILKNIVQNFGFTSDEACDGQEAIDMVTQASKDGKMYDFIFMDWQMPNMNGKQAIQKIHTMHENGEIQSKIPTILMVSAHTKDEIDLSDVQIESFLPKPFTSSTLFDAISDAKGIAQSQHQVDTSNNTTTKDFEGLNILLVEDNEVNQLVATMMLKKVGIKAEVANNGQEGVDKYLANPSKYDLILMDLQMPVLSGYEATAKIREKDKEVPIIALTAAAMIEDKEKVLEAGMNEHLSKPIDKKELYRVIEQFSNTKTDNTQSKGKKEDIKQKSKIIDYEALYNITSSKELAYTLLHKLQIQLKSGEFKDIVDQIKNNTQDAHKKVHSLKGVSGNIQAQELYDICFAIDKKYKEDQTISSEDITALQNAIGNFLGEVETFVKDEPKTNTQILQPQELEELFDKTKTALEESNLIPKEQLELLVANLQDKVDKNQLMRFKELVEQFEFDEALEIMGKLR